MYTLLFGYSLLTYQNAAQLVKRMKTVKVAQTWPHMEIH